LRVADTGLGLAFDYAERGTNTVDGHGLGNINIRERLQALYGIQAALITEIPESGGASFTLQIPLEAA